MAAERRFRAMGSDAHVVVVGGPPRLVDDLEPRIARLEQRWSRFIDASEVSELTRRAGQFVPVSQDTALLVTRAVEAWRLTGGAYDPTVLGAVIRAGYDRSFERIGPTALAGSSPLGPGAEEICIRDDAVRLPPNTGFDPGGIGKGLAADVVCAEIMAAGAEGVCVNLGGDVRVTGAGPGGGAWTVGIEHPTGTEPVALVGLADGAVATSTTLRRAWTIDGERRHHLIDPRTGRPAETDVVLATVVAGEAWRAEVLAKAVILAGSAHPFDILGGTGAEAIAVDTAGAVSATQGMRAFLGENVLREAIG